MKYCFALSFLFLYQLSFAQKKPVTRYLDRNQKETTQENAVFITTTSRISDTAYLLETYVVDQPMLRQETFKDAALQIRHGRAGYYGTNGEIDSTGIFRDGKMDGEWLHYGDSLKIKMKKHYQNGNLMNMKTRNQMDSMELDNGNPTSVQQNSVFPGGPNGWYAHCLKHQKYPKEAIKNEKEGTVSIFFSIDETGQTDDIIIYRSVDHDFDHAALPVIQRSPKWVPAKVNGKFVKTYKIQPIVFRLR